MATPLRKEEDCLREELHEVRKVWHETCHHEQCLPPEPRANAYREEILEMTDEIDHMREEHGEPIEEKY